MHFKDEFGARHEEEEVLDESGQVNFELFSEAFHFSTLASAEALSWFNCFPKERFSSAETVLNSSKSSLKTPFEPKYLILNCSASSRVDAVALSSSSINDCSFSEKFMPRK